MSSKSLPIYEGQAHSLPKISDGNAGLHFVRLYDGYFANDEDTAKSSFLKKFAKALGDSEQLKQHALRQMALTKAVQGDVRIYALEGHFVTGMGNAHPVENGFSWHYTLGVPYLAGSQVKGMVRSMIERYLDADTKDKGALLLKWFGSIDKEPPKNPLPKDDTARAGELIFFDALPYQPPLLTVDIMTPHMGDWYAKGGDISSLQDSDKIPADWHEPTPIPFLAVRDAKFVFSIGKRAGSDIDLAEVWDVLDKALNYLGAGAKTNTGFGYMREDEKTTRQLIDDEKEYQKRQKEARDFVQAQANSSTFHTTLLAVAYEQNWEQNNDAGKTAFTQALTGEWLEKLEANPDETKSIVYMLERARQHYPTQMKNPDHKKVKPNQREWIKRLLALEKH